MCMTIKLAHYIHKVVLVFQFELALRHLVLRGLFHEMIHQIKAILYRGILRPKNEDKTSLCI